MADGAKVPGSLSPADSPAVIAHINLIQGIINRLAGNSSSCKTWCITLVSALLSLAGATHTPTIATVTLVPLVIFGFMDTLYLTQERAYRGLYTRVVLKVRGQQYQLGDAFDAAAPFHWVSALKSVKSWSIYPVYGGLLVLYGAAYWMGWFRLLAKV